MYTRLSSHVHILDTTWCAQAHSHHVKVGGKASTMCECTANLEHHPSERLPRPTCTRRVCVPAAPPYSRTTMAHFDGHAQQRSAACMPVSAAPHYMRMHGTTCPRRLHSHAYSQLQRCANKLRNMCQNKLVLVLRTVMMQIRKSAPAVLRVAGELCHSFCPQQTPRSVIALPACRI